MRLIDADALNDSMYHEAFETDSELQKWDSGCWIRYKMFENHLDNAPTIDAVPVVRGEWVAFDPLNTERPYNWTCSSCGYGCVDYRTAYCPDCGAKMEDKLDEILEKTKDITLFKLREEQVDDN